MIIKAQIQKLNKINPKETKSNAKFIEIKKTIKLKLNNNNKKNPKNIKFCTIQNLLL